MKKLLFAILGMVVLLSGLETWAGANISPEAIQEIALNFLQIRSRASVGQIKLWQGASLSDPVPYHDFSGNEIAYCYSLVNDKRENLGYIILSNKETEHPIQEFSASPPPHKRSLATCRKEAEKYILANKLSGHLGQPSFIYVCPSIYFAQFPLLDESSQKTNSVFVEMRSATVVDNLKTLQEPGFTGHRKRNPYWRSMASKSPSKANDSFSYIDNVPIYEFFISSHATAAAMVLGHWNLKRPEEPAKPFIGEITNYIKTCGCGKTEEILEMARGIKGFSSLRGYKIEAREWSMRSTNPKEQMTFEEYQKEIEDKRPMVVSFMHKNRCARDLSSAKRCDIQTCVAGVGYLSDGTGNHIIAHEGFFFKEKPPNETTSGNPRSNPGVAFYNWDSISSNMILTTVNKPEKF